MLISAVTEETRRYLLDAYEPFNFDFVLKKMLVITTNLTNPESAPAAVVQPTYLLKRGLLQRKNLIITLKF